MIDGNLGFFPSHVSIQIGFLGVTGHSMLKSRPKLTACFFKKATAGSAKEN